MLSSVPRQIQFSLCQRKWFKETLNESIPTLQKGWMTLSFSLLDYCQTTRDLAQVAGKISRAFFFFLKNISLKRERRTLGAKFSNIPRCQCVSLLPAKQFTPFLQGQQVFYPSQRQTNEGTEEVRSPALTDSSWQQEGLAVTDWLMLLVKVGMQQSLSLLW